MKQIVLDLKSGNTTLMEVPAPMAQPGMVLIQTTCSLVSPGTERMLVDFGKAGWIQKARQQPERVQQVLHKIKTDGLKPTLDAVFSKLGQPLPLGYSQAGIVIGVGKGVTRFKTGDRVISNGYHAEVVSVSQNLVAKIPDNVSDEDAAFTVLGAIALQSIRLMAPSFGETIAVIGMGLIGQLTMQLLRANGCTVVGFDIDEEKINKAREDGFLATNTATNDAVAYALSLREPGMDGVIITASSDSNALISEAARMCRKRGRIILTGVTGLDINRADFYEKEISFQVSCSYGPGRYEPGYEQKGLDYPIGFVRWTEQRNFEAILEALANGQLQVAKLISAKLPLDQYRQIYNHMQEQPGASLLLYDPLKKHEHTITIADNAPATGISIAGIIGAGNFTTGVLLPSLKKTGIAIKSIASKGGLSAANAARKFGISTAATDASAILNDPAVDIVFITTRHQHHAAMVVAALQAGKHVFVEKPLAIDTAGLEQITAAYQQSGRQLFVGFNRRFAPLAIKMKELLWDAGGPLNIVVTVNAGSLPANHWLNETDSGGRLIGEACHFIDLCQYLSGAAITHVCANSSREGDASILLRFANGSNAVVNYFSNGSKAYDKERVEVYADGRTLVLENWRQLSGYGFKRFSSQKTTQDKGHNAQFKHIIDCLKRSEVAPIPFDTLLHVSKAVVAINESIVSGQWISII
jgi:predicted dehydrogenase